MPRSLTGAASAFALFAGLVIQAHAADTPSFDELDKNHDGKVSVAEASGHDTLFVAFKSLDKDRDGMLTREEFAAFQKK